MARSRAKVDDGPAITVRVEKGRLVPVSQYDQELLGSWREGALLNIRPVLASVRPLERRYFAMLSKLLQTTETPWTNVLAAHKAIKQATGFVTPHPKTWEPQDRHISTFTDTELSEYYELFCGIVRERFGVDPETLNREAPSSDAVTPVPELDGSPDALQAGVGVERSPDPPNPGNGDAEAGDGGDEITPHTPLSPADYDWLKLAARMLTAASSPGGEVDILLRQAHTIKTQLTPPDISQRARNLISQVYRHCLSATKDNTPLDKKLVATLAGCEVTDLRPEAR